MVRGRELAEPRNEHTRMGATLAHEQKTRIAIGVLMERERVDRKRALELLRSRARAQRRRISERAQDILDASETLSGFAPRRE